MDLLVAITAAERVGHRLTAIDPSLRLLLIDGSGRIHLEGVECPEGDCVPEIAWLSLDTFVQGQLPRFTSVLQRSAPLSWVHTVHAGLDLPLYSEFLQGGVRLSNSHAHAPALAEYVLANVMAVFQSHDQRVQLQRESVWKPMGFKEIGRSRWLIVGLGHAGSEVAARAKAFGAHVTGVRRTASRHSSVDVMAQPDEVLRLLPNADVVVLCCPLTHTTERLVDAGFLAAMKDNAVLVNIGRGALIDEAALIQGLDIGRPGFAVLDVTRVEPLPVSSPLWTHQQVRLTAHSAFAGDGTTSRGDELFLENLRRYCVGEALLNEVTEVRLSQMTSVHSA